MLGHKPRDFKTLTAASLEDLVPEDNFYRQVERSIDLSFVHELANKFYSSIGRPSVNPVVFFKLQLIAFFEGIRSERQLMETVNLNLAHRWFIGYDLAVSPEIRAQQDKLQGSQTSSTVLFGVCETPGVSTEQKSSFWCGRFSRVVFRLGGSGDQNQNLIYPQASLRGKRPGI